MTRTIVAESEAMKKVMAVIERVAPTDASLYLWGEAGAGCEYTARRIHERSRRADGPWVWLDWRREGLGLPISARMFGCTAGACPGVPEAHDGFLRRAAGGTIYLDDVASFPAYLQMQLLEAIRAGRFRPLGAAADVPLEARFMASSYERPETAIAQGRLLPGLYERLSEAVVEIPPLRWRREDIPGLVEQMVDEGWRADGPPPRLSDKAMRMLAEHPWPRNNMWGLGDVITFTVLDSPPGHEVTAGEVATFLYRT